MAEDLKFKHTFTCIISGPTGSGKTTFCLKFLQNLETLCTEPTFAVGIVSCYSEETAITESQLSALRKNIRYHKGVPHEFGNERGTPSLIILDDLLNHVYSEVVCDIICKRQTSQKY
jgi:broad-specificity NMP kinase